MFTGEASFTGGHATVEQMPQTNPHGHFCNGVWPAIPTRTNCDMLTAKRGRVNVDLEDSDNHQPAVPEVFTDTVITDEEGFRSVSHRRNRKQGITPILSPAGKRPSEIEPRDIL